MSSVTLNIELPPEEKISEFCREHNIRRLSVFGSALGDDFGKDSDIDILVEFETGAVPGFFRLMEMQDELTKLVGRKVDIRTPGDLSRYFRGEMLEAAEVLYGEG